VITVERRRVSGLLQRSLPTRWFCSDFPYPFDSFDGRRATALLPGYPISMPRDVEAGGLHCSNLASSMAFRNSLLAPSSDRLVHPFVLPYALPDVINEDLHQLTHTGQIVEILGLELWPIALGDTVIGIQILAVF